MLVSLVSYTRLPRKYKDINLLQKLFAQTTAGKQGPKCQSLNVNYVVCTSRKVRLSLDIYHHKFNNIKHFIKINLLNINENIEKRIIGGIFIQSMLSLH